MEVHIFKGIREHAKEQAITFKTDLTDAIM